MTHTRKLCAHIPYYGEDLPADNKKEGDKK